MFFFEKLLKAFFVAYFIYELFFCTSTFYVMISPAGEHLLFLYGCPSASVGNWFQDSLQIPRSADAQVLYVKCYSICISLYLHAGYSRVCLHITLFACIHYSAGHVANSSFAVWNFLGFLNFSPKYFQTVVGWIRKCETCAHGGPTVFNKYYGNI